MTDSNKGSLRTFLAYVVTIVTAIALFGALGFHHFESGVNPNVKGFWDSFWWTMVTLTTIGYGDIYPVTVGGRIVAMLLMLAGIGTLGVMTAAIAAYFVKDDPLQLLRLRRLKDHVVICGLGNKGFMLARAFRERGRDVVVIEKGEANDFIGPCKEAGALVLVGDATEPEVLAKARLAAAKHLIAVCGDDGANAEITAHARDLAGDRSGGPLTCTTHIVDSELWYLLRRWEIAAVGPLRLQFFNVFDTGARAMLAAHPPFAGAGSPDGAAPHLLVVGAGMLGQNLAVHAARLWRDHPLGPDQRLKVTLVDAETAHLREHLHMRHPGLDRVCEIEALSIDVRSPEYHRAAFLYDGDERFCMTAVYVCVDDDALGLSAALALLHHARRHRIPIVVRMTQDAGLAALLQGVREGGRGFDNLYAFGMLEKTCQPDLILGGTNEVLARAIHAKYLADQETLGHSVNDNSLLVPWEKLPEEIRESNRSQADHIGLKLQAIGCDIAPLTDWDAATFAFAPAEVETMARMEHDRWAAERRAQGWTCGPRDPERRTNPNLVPWEDLPEASREANREAVRELPALLARAGFQIYRLRPA